MRRTTLIVVIALVVVAVAAVGVYLFAGSSGGDTTKAPGGPTTVITDPAVVNAQLVAFVRNPYKDDYDMSRIPGYIDNKGNTWVKTAMLEIQLFDADGNQKELVKYEITDIPPNGRKTFDANAGSLGGNRTATGTIVQMEVVGQ